MDAEAADELLALTPDGNVGADRASGFVQRVVEGSGDLADHLADEADRLGADLEEQHQRVREAARRKGVRYRVEPHRPPDVLGVFVLLPAEA